ncbi:hypothetical protein BLA29_001888, partial [Euroglyphus maynei]
MLGYSRRLHVFAAPSQDAEHVMMLWTPLSNVVSTLIAMEACSPLISGGEPSVLW